MQIAIQDGRTLQLCGLAHILKANCCLDEIENKHLKVFITRFQINVNIYITQASRIHSFQLVMTIQS